MNADYADSVLSKKGDDINRPAPVREREMARIVEQIRREEREAIIGMIKEWIMTSERRDKLIDLIMLRGTE